MSRVYLISWVVAEESVITICIERQGRPSGPQNAERHWPDRISVDAGGPGPGDSHCRPVGHHHGSPRHSPAHVVDGGDLGTALLDLALTVDPAVTGQRRYQWSTASPGPDRGWLCPSRIELTFSTLPALPSFLVRWEEIRRPGQRALIRDHLPRVVNIPADKLAAQEWHYANEGADMDSLCQHCYSTCKSLQLLPAQVGSADPQFCFARSYLRSPTGAFPRPPLPYPVYPPSMALQSGASSSIPDRGWDEAAHVGTNLKVVLGTPATIVRYPCTVTTAGVHRVSTPRHAIITTVGNCDGWVSDGGGFSTFDEKQHRASLLFMLFAGRHAKSNREILGNCTKVALSCAFDSGCCAIWAHTAVGIGRNSYLGIPRKSYQFLHAGGYARLLCIHSCRHARIRFCTWSIYFLQPFPLAP
eukprot:2962069-Rhodomonas_salina.2